MRHVSRNHRVALDWLFNRINLDVMIQIKYVDTKNHFVDLLTRCSYTCDEGGHLLRLFNIMNFSILSCSQFLPIKKTNTMSKGAQERKTVEEPAVAKPWPTCLMSRNQLTARQTASVDSGASNVPGSTEALVRDRFQNPATSSQEWQKDNPCIGSTKKLVQSDACERSGSIGKSVQGVENQLARTRLDFHNMQISDCQFVEKFFENVQQKLRRSSYEFDAKTNVSIWWLFMSTTMKASVDFGFHYNENLVA